MRRHLYTILQHWIQLDGVAQSLTYVAQYLFDPVHARY